MLRVVETPAWRQRPAAPYVSGAALGLAYGLFARFLFASGAEGQGPIVGVFIGVSVCFLLLVPFGLGALVASQVPATASWRWARFALLPLLPSLLLMLTALALAWEGLICIVLAAPIFLGMAVVGGLAMGIVVVSREGRRRDVTAVAVAAVLLPLAMAPVEARVRAPDDLREVVTSIAIAAPASAVWEQIVRVPEIRTEELGFSPFALIGIPRPLEATLSREGIGGVRTARFRGGLRFAETLTEWSPERSFAFDIAVEPGSVRPDVLDRHVLVGGVYFDVLRGRFEIEPRDGGVALHLTSRHRLTTRLNTYAGYWTDAIMADLQRTICEVVKARAEAASP